MRRSDWIIIFSLVFVVWFLDAATKWIALEYIKGVKFWGPFGLVLHHNPGAMLGMFADLPPILRIVSLSTGGAFLIFIYAAIQYLLPRRSMILRAGMSILLGGILGNVTDRIVWGAVVDFLLLGSHEKSTPAFNVADALQWVGYGMVVFSLIKNGNQFWPESNIRKQIWVNPTFQAKFISVLISIGVGFSIISGVFSYTYLKITIEDLVVGRSQAIEDKFLDPFIITFFIIAFGFAVLLFVLGRILSHRIAGPLYAFERFLDDLLAGKDRKLKLRAGDDFIHLEELSEKVREIVRQNNTPNQPAPETPPAQEPIQTAKS